MEKKIIELEFLKEKIECFTLSNGLDVYLYHNEELKGYYANYATHFGSNDLTLNDKSLPDGVAHFLEHVMFNSEDGDGFELFSKNGANANAYTSFNQTSYVFDCNDNFLENLNTLIKMVQVFYLNDDLIQKELGIIEEEIKMYDSNPGHVMRTNILDSLVTKTNYNIDILGTIESINSIKLNTLKDIHYNYYVPSNQALFISGNFTNMDMIKELEEIQVITSNKDKIKKKKEIETLEVKTPEYTFSKKEATQDVYSYNLKFESFGNMKEDILDYFALIILDEYLFNKINQEYINDMNSGRLNESFRTSITVFEDFKFLSFRFMDLDPDEVISLIEDRFNSIEFDDNIIDALIKKTKAEEIQTFEFQDHFIDKLSSLIIDGITIEDYYDVVLSLSVDDIKSRINHLITNKKETRVYLERE